MVTSSNFETISNLASTQSFFDVPNTVTATVSGTCTFELVSTMFNNELYCDQIWEPH